MAAHPVSQASKIRGEIGKLEGTRCSLEPTGSPSSRRNTIIEYLGAIILDLSLDRIFPLAWYKPISTSHTQNRCTEQECQRIRLFILSTAHHFRRSERK